MPSKYVVHPKRTRNRFLAAPRTGIIAWEEGCLKCEPCVKKRCVYGVYDNRDLNGRQMLDTIDINCMNCLRCVQNCPMELIHKSINPEYEALGDGYWTPDIIARLYYQAETGKIPVSGAGYSGPFAGPGFDSMWTDMSEIVRPTRDGIHGREYISTQIDMGRTPKFLEFNGKGNLVNTPRLVDIPLPIILRRPSFGSISRATTLGWAGGAKKLSTLFALPAAQIDEDLKRGHRERLIPIVKGTEGLQMLMSIFPLVEIGLENLGVERAKRLIDAGLAQNLIITLPVESRVAKRALELALAGAAIIHIKADEHGLSDDGTFFIKDAIRDVHGLLVEEGVRDEVTVLASGGLAMAEHVAKAIICGADGAFADLAGLIALECRVCRRCTKGLACPVEIESVDPEWAASRVRNLMGAWHNQLLEVMGAMGIRDIRRLRGESGRAMFFEDLDEEIFGKLGELRKGCELG